MRKFVYPVILFRNEEESSYTVLFPDLDMVASGDSVEEAYLEAEEYLHTYLQFAVKMGSTIAPSTSYEDTKKLNPNKVVLLVSVKIEDAPTLTNGEKEYKNFIQKFVYQTED